MSGPDQRKSTKNGKSAYGLHRKFADRTLGGEREADAGGVKCTRRDGKSRSIGDEAVRNRLGAVCVSMKESEQTDQGYTQP